MHVQVIDEWTRFYRISASDAARVNRRWNSSPSQWPWSFFRGRVQLRAEGRALHYPCYQMSRAILPSRAGRGRANKRKMVKARQGAILSFWIDLRLSLVEYGFGISTTQTANKTHRQRETCKSLSVSTCPPSSRRSSSSSLSLHFQSRLGPF